MMWSSTPLSGDWLLSSPPLVREPVPALVPNDIADDLERAGLIPDLYFGVHSMNASRWIWERSWTLHRSFETPPLGQGGAAWLAFEGVDYNCSVSLNGKILGSHVGAFEAFEFDVSRELQPVGGDNNSLELTLHAPPSFILEDLYPKSGAPPGYPISNEGLDHCRVNRRMLPWRSRLNFWDFATKHWSSGIWKGVALKQTAGAARLAPNLTLRADLAAPYDSAVLIAQVAWRTLHAVPPSTTLRLRLSAACVTDASVSAGAAEAAEAVEVVLPTDGGGPPTTAWQTARLELRVVSPRLWWPSGYGEQHLYSVQAALLQCTPAGGCAEADAVVEPSFGFRELAALRNPSVRGAPADASWLYAQWGQGDAENQPWILNSSNYAGRTDPRAWALAVNGRKVFLRGGNWVPSDQMFGRGVRLQGRLRAILTLARDAGYTFLRVDGVGLVEDQSFYRLCDELGLLIEQEMPLAGCSYTPADWKDSTQLDSWARQLPPTLAQLVNHPSVARYSMANEFYLNATFSPIASQYEAIVSAYDPSRIVRQSDPVCIGQRHGPYAFAAIGARNNLVGGYEVYGRGCGNFPQAGCTIPVVRAGGPGDPFEWTEFGVTGLSDAATLRTFMVEDELYPTGASPTWAWHKGDGNPYTSWQAKVFYSELFLERNGSAAFGSIEIEVAASQWLQAEGYRYAYQAARRAKPHRSAMVKWAFNEPWPNAAHQCIVDFRGRTKHAHAWVRQALAMVDVSLEYYALVHVADGATPHAVALWLDSELSAPAAACCVHLEHFYLNGSAAAPTEVHRLPGGMVPPGQPTRISDVRTRLPAATAGEVVLSRVSLVDADGATVAARHTYAFAPVAAGVNTSTVDAPMRPLLHAPRATLALTATPEKAGTATPKRGSGGGDTVALSVVASAAAALFVELSLCDGNGTTLPFVSLSANYMTLRPGESADALATILWDGGRPHAARSACARAWNAERVCVSLDAMGMADSADVPNAAVSHVAAMPDAVAVSDAAAVADAAAAPPDVPASTGSATLGPGPWSLDLGPWTGYAHRQLEETAAEAASPYSARAAASIGGDADLLAGFSALLWTRLRPYFNKLGPMAANTAPLQALSHAQLALVKSAVRCALDQSVAAFGEDLILLPTLLRAAGGVAGSFVEIGALDGMTGSNTLALERCFGWQGLLIEGNKKHFGLLNQSGRAAIKLHSAVCKHPRTPKEGFVYWRTHLSDAEASLAKGKAAGKLVAVPCAPLSRLILEGGLRKRVQGPGSRVTFLSLDVEGNEARVLQTVDPKSFDVLIAETWRSPQEENRKLAAEVDAVLTNGGLVESQQLWVHMSRTYLRRGVTALPMPGWPHEGAAGGQLSDAEKWSVAKDYMGRGMNFNRHADVKRMVGLALAQYKRPVG